MDQTQPAAPAPQVRRSKDVKGKMITFLAVLVLLAAGAAAGYYYRDMQAKDDAKAAETQIAALKTDKSKLEKDLAAAKKTSGEETAAGIRPSTATLDNIEASVKSGNYAALVGYSASTVKVIIAASEGVGDRTPTQAASDIAYLDTGTDPWDFNLSAATLNGYQTGNYKQYFPETAFVGKAANGYVVSFQFDSAGKINGIFMAANL